MRLATGADIPHMVVMLRRCFDEMDFKSRGYSFNSDTCSHTLWNVINGNGFVIVNDSITAIFGAFKVPSFMDCNDIKMVEFIFHTDPLLNNFTRAKLSKGLIIAAEQETRRQGVNRLNISAAYEPKNASDFIVKHGYSAHEISFSKEL